MRSWGKIITVKWVGLYLSGCTVLSILNAISAVRDYQRNGGQEIWQPIVWESTSVFVMVLLAIVVFRFTARYPFTRDNWGLRFGQHLLASVVFSLLHILMMVGLRKLIYVWLGSHYIFGDWLREFVYEFSKDLLTYASVVAVSTAVLVWRGLNRQRLKALTLEADLADLKLRRLQEQLRPHFLFNTLNLISSCMYEDVEKADGLMADLCTLLRYSLNEENLSTAPLADEMHFLRLYLSLLNQRFGGRLQTVFQIGSDTGHAQTPRFLLQPLVENAVQHGFKQSGGRGKVCIRATRRGERLVLEVSDDGAGLAVPVEQAFASGLGLSNTRAMLAQLYGEDFSFTLRSGQEKGVDVLIDIPFSEKRHVLAATG